MALKSARIVGFCGKSRDFEEFVYTLDCGSAVIFDAELRIVPGLIIGIIMTLLTCQLHLTVENPPC